MFRGDERPATQRRWVELPNHENATGPKGVSRGCHCRGSVRQMMEGVGDEDGVDGVVCDREPSGVAKDDVTAASAGPSGHPRGSVDDHPLWDGEACGGPTGPAGNVEKQVDGAVCDAQTSLDGGAPRGRHRDVVEAGEAVERAQVARAVHTSWTAARPIRSWLPAPPTPCGGAHAS